MEGSLASFANPSSQNACYQFVQTTAPTQRSSGVPLVSGDRWSKVTDGTEWFWNGTYWLSEQKIFYTQVNTNAAGGFSLTPRYWYYPTSGGLFLSHLTFYSRLTSPFTQGWSLKFQSYFSVDANTLAYGINDAIVFANPLIDLSVSGSVFARFTKVLNTRINVNNDDVGNHEAMQLEVTHTGGGLLIQPGVAIYYHQTL